MILQKVVELLTGRKRALYIKIGRNSLTVRDVFAGQSHSVVPDPAFTTRRLLVGDFLAASKALESLLKKLYSNRLLTSKVPAVVHPLEMIEDGLSPVEHRVLLELTETALSRAVAIHTGHELTDVEVQELAKTKPLQSGA